MLPWPEASWVPGPAAKCSKGLTALAGLWETEGEGAVVEKEGFCWHVLGQNPLLGDTHGLQEGVSFN